MQQSANERHNVPASKGEGAKVLLATLHVILCADGRDLVILRARLGITWRRVGCYLFVAGHNKHDILLGSLGNLSNWHCGCASR